MVPRPEYEITGALPDRRAPFEGTCSSSSDDELVTAKLVKHGQLCNFSTSQRFGRQSSVTSSHTGGSECFRKEYQERGRNVNRKMPAKGRNARSQSRDQIQIGDRVMVKDKYIGTCRYLGEIQEKNIYPEIFVGVELDEPLTNNSGIFGSYQYFDCEHGYGLMVSLSKTKKIRGQFFSKLQRKRAQSEPRKKHKNLLTRTRISEGARIYDFNNHGKSQSLLHSNRQLFNKSHPMDTLNNIKRYQSEHGTYGAHPDERQHSMFNHLSQGFPFGSDLLRESFRRIVEPSGPMYYDGGHALYRNASLPPMYAGSHYSTQSLDEMHRTRSMPGRFDLNSHRDQSKYDEVSYDFAHEQHLRSNFVPLAQPQLPRSQFPIKENSPQNIFYKYRKPLCTSCATCATCTPIQLSEPANFMLNTNFNRKISSEESLSNYNSSVPEITSYRKPHVESPRAPLNPPPALKYLEPRLKLDTIAAKKIEPVSMEKIDYEIWKKAYGTEVGRKMKKGLNKLSQACY